MDKIVRATAPPTIANLAVGFDLLGLAVQGQGDIVTARFGENTSLIIDRIVGDGGKLSTDIQNNTISAGVKIMLDELKERAPGFDKGIVLSLDKRMPLGSGLGSSASSAAASVMAVNELLDSPFNKEELVRYALIGESVASGAIHGDNVVPSLLGGLVLVRENEPADVIRLPFIEDLFVLIAHPHVEVMTSASRGRLKSEVSMQNQIRQGADLASFVHAMHTRDKGLLARCMNDHIIGPQRRQDIPFFDEARIAVIGAGGMNYDISGSGPSTFAFFEKAEQAMQAGEEIEKILKSKGIESDVHVTRVDMEGARVVAS
jgi:homoserine kinase